MNDFEKKYCEEFFKDPSRNPKTKRKILSTGKVYKNIVKSCDKYKIKSRSKSKIKSRSKSKIKSRSKSKSICQLWLKNKNINPRTNRKIITDGPVYKKLEKECYPLGQKNIKQSKEYSLPSFKIKDELQWNGHPTLKLTEMTKCLQDIIVDKYLSHGAYGVVYKVDYKGKECAMKLSIIDKKPIKPTRRENTLKNLEKEYELYKKVSDLGIAPKVYLFKTCDVKMPNKFKNKVIKIAIMIIELMDITLKDYMKNLTMDLNKYLVNPLKFESFKEFEEKISEILENLADIDNKIKYDALLFIKKFNINNRDIHTENVMLKKGVPYITDWGLTSNNKIQTPHQEYNKNYYFSIKWLEQFMETYKSLLKHKNYKEYLSSLKNSLELLNRKKFTDT